MKQNKKINNQSKINKLSCLFVESILGCGGQVILPKKLFKGGFQRS